MSIAFESVSPPPFPIRRFTVAEYHRLGETGILTEDDAVELLEGFIAPKMIRTPQHDAVVGLVEQALRKRLPPGWSPRVQSAITTATSEPEPDVAIVRGEPRDYLRRHPSGADIALIVEVADSSLDRDRTKAAIYAAAGAPAYWIVNLVDECVEAHAQPNARHRRYGVRTSCRRGEEVPLVIGKEVKMTIDASELLP
ncbi:MAG: Uma2 family endonuclease [Planctomycetes bacterium]|nr:Uma2 family endonuclease [Planctomycetota bacterium]